MDQQNARLAVLPRALASEVVTSAITWAAWAVAIAVLLLTVPVLIDTFSASESELLVPLLCIAGLLGLLALTGARPGRVSRVAYIAGGSVLATIYIVSVIAADPDVVGSIAYLLNRPAFVLVLASAGVRRPLRALAWNCAGFLTALAVIAVADTIAGMPLNFGWGPAIAIALSALTFTTLASVGGAQRKIGSELRKLEEVTRRLALEHQFEMRAAALIHDTVLNDLTVVMNSLGPISDKARERLRRDVATLDHAAWLRESRSATPSDAADSALRNGMVAVVSEMQWLGLTVDVTGNPEEDVVRLSPERLEATHAAVRACLHNVLAHSGVRTAAVVIGLTDESVTIMVIDEGSGFDPEAVAADRLGLRNSVVQRVQAVGGTVRVWSKPGSGTSVMITMPGELVHAAEEPS